MEARGIRPDGDGGGEGVPTRHVLLTAMQVLPHGLPLTHLFCALAVTGSKRIVATMGSSKRLMEEMYASRVRSVPPVSIGLIAGV